MDVARRFPYRRVTPGSLLIQAQSAQEIATWQLVLWLTMLVFARHAYVAGPVVVSAGVALFRLCFCLSYPTVIYLPNENHVVFSGARRAE
jgi:hypothetical protein